MNVSDIDECERGTDECDRNLARCKNLIGDYECMCVYGYSGNGKKGNCAGKKYTVKVNMTT